MTKYIIKRILQLVPMWFLVSFIMFMLLRCSNISPIAAMLGDKQTTPEVVAQLEKDYNLDKPLTMQYFIWITNFIKGDFGIDYKMKQSVNTIIETRLPVTLGIVGMGVTFGFIIAVIAGVICALKNNTWVDQLVSILLLLIVSAPNFVIATLLLMIVVKVNPNYAFVGSFSNFAEYIERLALPSIVTALSMIAMTGRVTRSSMIEQLKSNYVTTATAKGISSFRVTFVHAFRNAMIPVLTIATMYIGTMIGGTVLIESVFSLSGIGSLLVTSIQQSNYPVTQAVMMIMLTVYLTVSLVTDILYAVVDPRVRQKMKG